MKRNESVRDVIRERFSGQPLDLIRAQILIEQKKLLEASSRIEALEELYREQK